MVPGVPMLATVGPLPTGAGWAYEFKWDGVRALATVADGLLVLRARSGADITVAYPELAGLAAAVAGPTPHGTPADHPGAAEVAQRARRRPPDGAVDPDAGASVRLDGEIVLLDPHGRPSFTALAERMHVRDPARAARLAAGHPVTYMIFDLLRYRGRDLTGQPYRDRRELLESLGLAGPHWLVPPRFADGPATLAAAREYALEGVVAKRLASPYRPGSRSLDWVKVKLEDTRDFVVGGWRPGARPLGALLVGVPAPGGQLSFRGRVGGGISAAAQRELLAALAPLASPDNPFVEPLPREDVRDARWVRPELVVEVRYGQRTPDGRLRFPRFRRLRPDKSPAECADG